MLYPSYGDLQQKIARYAQTEDENVMMTNGSDQGMELIFRTFVSDGDRVVIPQPSFAMFYQVAEAQGAEIVKPKYNRTAVSLLKKLLNYSKLNQSC